MSRASVCGAPKRQGVAAVVGGEADGGRGLADGVAQHVSVDPAGRGLPVLAGGIQADHGVEVDDAACLVLGHLDVADADQGAEPFLGEPRRRARWRGR